MKLSIIIPVFNCEDYIEECLNSIVEEVKVSNLVEVIVVNDGSTDGTQRVLQKYEKKYKINIINNLNYGVSFSRNYGIRRAKGDYIMFVDADDRLSYGWFNKVRDLLNDDADIIYFNSTVNEKEKIKVLKYIIGNNNNHICIAGPYSKLFRKRFLLDNNILFMENIINGEDMLFNMSALSHADTFKFVNYSFYQYRQLTGSATKRFDSNFINSDIQFHNYLKKYLDNFEMLPQIKEEFMEYCLMNAIMTIYDRISYLSNYRMAKQYIKKLYKYPYNRQLTGQFNALSLTYKIKYCLYKIQMNYILFLGCKIIRKIKFKNSENIFLEI